MQLILSAISAGGMAGAADQYLCLLILSVAARFGIIELMPPMDFMTGWWFIALVAILWVLTVAPAYATSIAPGVMSVINTVINFVSGFVVPLSSAILSLASVGVIVQLNPELQAAFETMQIFNGSGGIGTGGWVIAGGSAATAVTLTAMKGLAKPAIGVATGTAGHASAPIFATYETVASVVLMGLSYVLARIDPTLLIVLLAVMTVITAALLGYGIYQLWRLKRGLGKVLRLAQEHPRAGLSVVVEFFIWGLGWLVWGKYGRGAIMLAVWAIAVAVFIAIPTITAFFPPIAFTAFMFLLFIYVLIGINSAGALMKTLEKETPEVQTALANA